MCFRYFFANLFFEDALRCFSARSDTTLAFRSMLFCDKYWRCVAGDVSGRGTVVSASREFSLLRSVSPAPKHLAAGCFAAGSTWLKPRPNDRSHAVWSCSLPQFAKNFGSKGFESCGTNWCGNPPRCDHVETLCLKVQCCKAFRPSWTVDFTTGLEGSKSGCSHTWCHFVRVHRLAAPDEVLCCVQRC
jgi:hypothetical protein